MPEVAMGEQVGEERHFITQAEIASGDYQDQTLQTDWIYRKQVPINQVYVFKPQHRFGIYLQRLNEPVLCVLNDNGGTATETTTENNTPSAAEQLPTGAGEATDDRWYVGSHHPFTALSMLITTQGVRSAATDGDWEYYNADGSWVLLPGLTDGSVALTAAAGTVDVTWRYPSDMAWVVNPTDILHYAYWVRYEVATADYTTTPAASRVYIGAALEMDNPDHVEIQVRNASGTKIEKILDCQYEQCKELTESNKRMSLSLPDDYVVKGGQWIYIVPKCNGGLIDVSTCYFNLEVDRIRASMYPAV